MLQKVERILQILSLTGFIISGATLIAGNGNCAQTTSPSAKLDTCWCLALVKDESGDFDLRCGPLHHLGIGQTVTDQDCLELCLGWLEKQKDTLSYCKSGSAAGKDEAKEQCQKHIKEGDSDPVKYCEGNAPKKVDRPKPTIPAG